MLASIQQWLTFALQISSGSAGTAALPKVGGGEDGAEGGGGEQLLQGEVGPDEAVPDQAGADEGLPDEALQPTKPNLPNQTYQAKLTKPNLPNQTYQIKPTKPNLPN